MAKRPIFDIVIGKRIREHFTTITLGSFFSKGLERGKQLVELSIEYKFDLEHHLKRNNRNNSQYSSGCGCDYCRIREKITNEKIRLSRLNRSFESELYFYIKSNLSEEESLNAFKKDRDEIKDRIDSYYREKRELERVLLEMEIDIRKEEKEHKSTSFLRVQQ